MLTGLNMLQWRLFTTVICTLGVLGQRDSTVQNHVGRQLLPDVPLDHRQHDRQKPDIAADSWS